MNRSRTILRMAALVLPATALGQSTMRVPAEAPHTHQSLPAVSPAPLTIASMVDAEITAVEKEVVDAAEAMPEDKFNFSPESLNIPGADYKGVRTFAVQVKHVAASNYILWSTLTGEKFPQDYLGGDGPKSLTTKAEVMKFLEDSYALGHRAAATMTTQNMLQNPGHSTSSRLHRAVFAVAHAYDHYGQIVEYLRMNGIVPPASRAPSQ